MMVVLANSGNMDLLQSRVPTELRLAGLASYAVAKPPSSEKSDYAELVESPVFRSR